MIWIVLFICIAPFGCVLLFGAPYLPTRTSQVKLALDMLDLKKGEVFVDLGSGDGAVLIEAAKRGLRCYGYELNPLMWFISRVRTLKYGKLVTIYCRNFWHVPLPPETKGAFVFLLEKYMKKLDVKLEAELGNEGVPVVSYTFKIPGRKIVKECKAMTLYIY